MVNNYADASADRRITITTITIMIKGIREKTRIRYVKKQVHIQEMHPEILGMIVATHWI